MQMRLLWAKKDARETIRRWSALHYDAVWRFCRWRVGPDHASDVTQEVFVTATLKHDDYRPEVAPRTWLFGIALRHCQNASRKANREAPLDWLSDRGSPDPSADLIQREELRRALSALSEEHRTVVLLKEIEQLTYHEIAEILGIPAGTVKSRLHYAFLEMRKQLREPEADHS